jgi:hypothetical protein
MHEMNDTLTGIFSVSHDMKAIVEEGTVSVDMNKSDVVEELTEKQIASLQKGEKI